jgi:hypothetical protein
MSRARHKEKHASGGAIGGRKGMWVSGNPDVKKEAEGEEPYDKGDERKRGGKVKKKSEMHAEGEKSKHRADRPRRAKGGRVSGSDQNPFSSAKNGASSSSEPNVRDDRGMKVSRIRDERDNNRKDQN